MKRIIKNELRYQGWRFILMAAASFFPVVMVGMVTLFDNDPAISDKGDVTAIMLMGVLFAFLSGAASLFGTDEKESARVAMLMTLPVKGIEVWKGIVASRIITVLPGVIAVGLLPMLIPEQYRSYAITLASGICALLFLLVLDVQLHRGLPKAYPKWIFVTVLAWDIAQAWLIFWSSEYIVGQWTLVILTLLLYYMTFTKRRDYLAK